MHLVAYSGQVDSESPAEEVEVCRTEYAAKLSTCARIKWNAPSLASDKRRLEDLCSPNVLLIHLYIGLHSSSTVALNLDIN